MLTRQLHRCRSAVWMPRGSMAWLCCKSITGGGCPAVFLQTANVATEDGSFAVGAANGLPAAVEGLRAELRDVSKRLDRANEIIRHLVKLVDKERYAAEMAELEKCFEGGGGLFVTTSAEDLAKALQTPGARIVLLENHRYTLGVDRPIKISRTSVSITGNGATIEGNLQLSHDASLDASDVTFISTKCFPDDSGALQHDWEHSTTLPCIEATQRSRVQLRNCALIGGRDGLYLGIESHAKLQHVLIANCARGVYEGIGCDVHLSRCTMAGNFFHLVLLSRDCEMKVETLASYSASSVGAAVAAAPAGDETDAPVRFLDTSSLGKKQTRADIALDHNPITDTYAGFIHKGRRTELQEHLATCGLSDPVY